MDRAANNRKLREIVQEHRNTQTGDIQAVEIAVLTNRLIALMDECVEEALAQP